MSNFITMALVRELKNTIAPSLGQGKVALTVSSGSEGIELRNAKH